MPSKSHADDNLVFLYRCLEHHNGSKIDFNAVALTIGTKPSAARMRYTRLKARIDAAILSGEGVDVPALRATRKAAPIKTVTKKRKAMDKENDSNASALDDDDDDVDDMSDMKSEEEISEPPTKRQTRGKKIDLKDPFESDTGSSVRSYGDTGDEYEARDGSDDDELLSEEEEEEEEERARHAPRESKIKHHKMTAKTTPTKSEPNIPLTPRSTPNKSSKTTKHDTTASSSAMILGPTTPRMRRTPFEATRAHPHLPSQPKPHKRSATPAIQAPSPDEIRADLRKFTPGMMVPLRKPRVHEASRGRTPAQRTVPADEIVGDDDDDRASTSPSNSASTNSSYAEQLGSSNSGSPKESQTRHGVVSYFRRFLGS